jgi:hypothetical protein
MCIGLTGNRALPGTMKKKVPAHLTKEREFHLGFA